MLGIDKTQLWTFKQYQHTNMTSNSEVISNVSVGKPLSKSSRIANTLSGLSVNGCICNEVKGSTENITFLQMLAGQMNSVNCH